MEWWRENLAGACSVDRCTDRVSAAGLCHVHYMQQWRGEPFQDRQRIKQRRSTARDELGRKQCRDCDRWLDESEFGSNSSRTDGLRAECKKCFSDAHRQKAYGLSPSDIEQLIADQGGMCAGCGYELEGKFAIDHDHDCCSGDSSCGRCVRGILHLGCNSALGMTMDNPERLRSLADYLERTKNMNQKVTLLEEVGL